ncbi:MAG: HIT family protein [Flavobacteriales bacterium]|nr:HIT family protein [Flavobacteriales bacterium]
MMSIFSQIIAGEIPCYKIAETESCFAFLDISPLAKGHVLVVPKKEVDYYFDIDEDLFNELNIFSKSIAAAIKLAIPCQRIGVAIIGLEVPHAHIHLVPIDNVSDIDFSRPKLHLPPEEMQKIALAIIDKL